ncbi:MAG: AI-2E family transporter [Proteobacteria bacterium]|nr:AI-2E family transporter [Pseudomonadota bacterium]
MTTQSRPSPSAIASYILMALGLWLVMSHGLLAALFAGLLVFALVHMLAPLLAKKISSNRARMLAVAVLSVLIVTLLTAAIWAAVSFFRSDAGSIEILLQKLADIIEASRGQMPDWAIQYLPGDADALRTAIIGWLHTHSLEAKTLGQEAGRAAAHLLVGMIIGAMAAMYDSTEAPPFRPLAVALRERVAGLEKSFRQIVFAQVRISAINTALSALYILVILPLAGIHLPLAKTLVVITFVAGLLPVIGNLVSNTVLVIVALSHSLNIAIASLLFMVVIHKLEYFLNARIIGSHINARSWELLTAMLAMESVFGLHGVAAAPVLYAYVKHELALRELV